MNTSCSFRFGFWDVTAKDDASLAVNQNQGWADIDDANTDEDRALPCVATLEQDFGWPLDGTRDIMPDNQASIGWGWWYPVLSGSGGAYAADAVLTVSFAQIHSSAGVTLNFSGTLPSSVLIRWYALGGGLIDTKRFTPDKPIYFCENTVTDYAGLVISIPGLQHAGRWLRLERILFGAVETITDDRVLSAELTEEFDPSADTLPIGALELSFHTADGRFSLLDPSGLYQMFQKRQQLTAFKEVDGVRATVAVQYLMEASGTQDAVTKLSCEDVIGILDGVSFDGGLYTEYPVNDLLNDLLATEGIPYTLDSSYESETITGYLPIQSKRKCLQMLLFAIGATVDARLGTVTVRPENTTPVRAIEATRKVLGHKVTQEDMVTRVEVTAYSYSEGLNTEELSKAKYTAGTHRVDFSSPSRVVSVSGATLVTSHANYCTFTVTGTSRVLVTVTGYTFHAYETVFVKSAESLPAGVNEAVKSYRGCTLIDPEKGQAAADRLYSYHQRRYSNNGQILPGWEHAGETVMLTTPGGKIIRGAIENATTDLYKGCLETIKVRGEVVT